MSTKHSLINGINRLLQDRNIVLEAFFCFGALNNCCISNCLLQIRDILWKFKAWKIQYSIFLKCSPIFSPQEIKTSCSISCCVNHHTLQFGASLPYFLYWSLYLSVYNSFRPELKWECFWPDHSTPSNKRDSPLQWLCESQKIHISLVSFNVMKHMSFNVMKNFLY